MTSAASGGASGRYSTVLAIILVIWYAAAIGLNSAQVIERTLSAQPGWDADGPRTAHAQHGPSVCCPRRTRSCSDLIDSIFGWPIDSSPRTCSPRCRDELRHCARLSRWARCSARCLRRRHRPLAHAGAQPLPWIIASQTVPVLAIAPIVIVILGSFGLTGLFPKSIISMYLCFFRWRSRS